MQRSRFSDRLLLLLVSLLLAGTSSVAAYTLDEMLDLLESGNSSLEEHRLAISERSFDLARARAARFPSITGDITGTYMTSPMEAIVVYPDDLLAGIDWPAGMEPSSAGGPIELYGGQEPTYYQFNLSITQPIFTWGKISDSIRMAENGVEIGQLTLQSEHNTLKTTLEVMLDSLWYLQRIKEIIDQQAVQVARLVEISEQNFTYGFILKDEVLSAEIRLHEVELGRDSLSVEIDALCSEIGRLLGIPDFTPEMSDHRPDTAGMLAYDTAALKAMAPEAILEQQVGIELLDSYISLQETAERIRKNTIYWKPDLALRFDLSYAGSRFPFIETDWYRQDDASLNATVAISTTIWDGGTMLIERDAASLSVEQAVNSRVSAEREILYTFRQAASKLEYAQQRIEHAKNRIAVNEESISFREQQYANGIGMETDLILARLTLLESRLELYTAYTELSTQYHTIQSLLSGHTS